MSVRFDEKEAIELKGRENVLLEDLVLQYGKFTVQIVRKPNISEDELYKLKKSKGSKTLKAEDLEEYLLRGVLDAEILKEAG